MRAWHSFWALALVFLLVSIPSLAREIDFGESEPTPPPPNSVSVPSTSSTGSYTLSWQSVSGATYYQWREEFNGSWSSTWTTQGSGTSVALSGKPSGTYRYQVRSCNFLASPTCSSPRTSSTLVVTLVVIPGTPSSISISDGSSSSDGAYTVSWGASSNSPTSYQYRESINGDWGSWISTGASRSKAVSGKGNGTYAYQARGCNSAGCGTARTSSNVVVTLPTNGEPEDAPAAHIEPLPSVNSTEILDSGKVGAVAGEFRVNESGQATYNVPIFTPAGRAGVAPQVGLSYSSQGGKGILGLGWNLSAGSAISRCRQTDELDGVEKGVTLTLADRFCLDGQRLILESGTYGVSGSKYRTELASQTRVTAVGTAGNGPQYFKVERKDGSVSYYGKTTDSRLRANQVNSMSSSGVPSTTILPTVFTWTLSEFIDNPYLTTPNKIYYHYTLYENYGEQYLNRITYSPNNEIQFVYANRPFINGVMGVGSYSRISKNLKTIVVKDNGNEVRKYEVNYKQKQETIYDEIDDGVFGNPLVTFNVNEYPLRIETIVESAKNGNSSWVSKKPKTFSWMSSASGYTQGSYNTVLGYKMFGKKVGTKIYDGNYRFGDVNGDNYLDFVYARRSSGNIYYHVAKSKGTNANISGGSFTPLSCSISIGKQEPKDSDFTWSLIDHNGDGRSDLFTTDYNSFTKKYDLKVYLGNSNGCFNTSVINLGIVSDTHEVARPTDLNADGLPDIVYQSSGAWMVRFNQRTGNASTPFEYGVASNISFSGFPELPKFGMENGVEVHYREKYSFGRLKVADFDGDGKADVIVKRQETKICLNGDGPITDPNDPPLCQSYSKMGRYFALSNGEGQFNRHLTLPTNVKTDDDGFYLDQAMDLNGDGLADYLYENKDDSYWYYRLNTGKQLLPAVQLTALGKDYFPSFFDYNFDGRIDIAFTKDSKLKIIPGTENGFSNTITNTSLTIGSGNMVSMFADVNADGIQEHLRVDMDGDTQSIRVDRPKQANSTHRYVINKINNGLGNETVITYKPLTTTGLYTKGVNAHQLNWGAGSGCSGSTKSTMSNCSPVFDVNGPMYVVSKAESSSPHKASPSAKVGVSYRYGEARMQSKGRGFLGFEWLETTDLQTNMVTKSEYRQDYPYMGSPLKTTVTYRGNKLSEATNTWARKVITLASGRKIQLPYIHKSLENSWHLTCNDYNTVATNSCVNNTTTFASSTLTQNAYDNYGNVTDMAVLQSSSYVGAISGDVNNYSYLTKKRTVNTYSDNVSKWHLGRLTASTVTHSRSGKPNISRTSSFIYDATTGMLKEELIEPNGNNAEKLRTVHLYDGYGNKTLKRTCSSDVSSCATSTVVSDGHAHHINRWSTTVYDSQGRYAIKKLNAFSQVVSEVLARNILGQPTKVRSLSGDIAETVYDAFGGQVFTRSKTGAWSQTTKGLCSGTSNCPVTGVYYTKSEAAGGSLGYAYFDALGREIQKAGRSFDGRYSVTSTEYNLRGQAIKATEPVLQTYAYVFPNTTYKTVSEYDILGRPWKVTNPDGGITSMSFNGFSTETVNPKYQRKTEVKDASGKTISATDNLGGVLTYDYDATGNLLQLKLNGVVQSTMTYDKLGRKRTMWDADKGGASGKLWTYHYNALGEIVHQIDAKGQKITTWNDRLGRPHLREDYNSSGTRVSQHRWYYDNAVGLGYSKGLLTREHDLTSGYKVEPDYDHLGRVIHSESWIDGKYFIASTTYDQFGRVFQSFDAASSQFANAGTRNVYNQYGFLEKVRDARNGVNGQVYKTILAMDARGNVTHERSGNGVETFRSYFPKTGRLSDIESYKGNTKLQDLTYHWDFLGNLQWREQYIAATNQTLRETFAYDGLNRLMKSVHPNETMDLTYDASGNIKSKTGVGSYSYGQTRCGIKAGPHAVTYTSSGGRTYCYDYNGNMTSDTTGRAMQYSIFDKLTKVTKGTTRSEFAYAPSRSRYMRVDVKGSITTTTYYVGNVEVIKRSNESFTTYRRSLGGLVIDEKTNGQKNTSYIHTDHLGSTDVISNATGIAEQTFSFNAFGDRRNRNDWKTLNQDTWSIALSPADSNAKTSRGFTGHEQMDETGLIHMNGRVYEPTLGRFIQADPHIQAPSNSQSLNRYAYVVNNPLSYSDPTGYFFKNLFRGRAGKLAAAQFMISGGDFIQAAITKQEFTNPILNSIGGIAACTWGGPWGCAMHAHVSSWAFGNSYGASLRAGAIAYASSVAFSAIGASNLSGPAKVIAHGMVGGITSVLQGGKFGHGFVSAGLSKAITPYVNTLVGGNDYYGVAVTAIVGGTISRATGGKFANGAITAAMGYVFNYMQSNSATGRQQEKDFWHEVGELTGWNKFVRWVNGTGPQDAVKDLTTDVLNVSNNDDWEHIATIRSGGNSHEFTASGEIRFHITGSASVFSVEHSAVYGQHFAISNDGAVIPSVGPEPYSHFDNSTVNRLDSEWRSWSPTSTSSSGKHLWIIYTGRMATNNGNTNGYDVRIWRRK